MLTQFLMFKRGKAKTAIIAAVVTVVVFLALVEVNPLHLSNNASAAYSVTHNLQDGGGGGSW